MIRKNGSYEASNKWRKKGMNEGGEDRRNHGLK